MKRFAAMACAALLAVAPSAGAQDKPPVPKVLQGVGAGKGSGQWKVEPLEGAPAAGGRMMPAMTVCTENLAGPAGPQPQAKPDPTCKQKLLKDTASEAIVESTCKDRTTKVTMTRESAKSVLMSIESAGSGAPHKMKMRYTHIGACTAGQGAVTFDKDSPQCQSLRQQAKVDPVKTCERQSGNREQCIQGMRQMAERFNSMCGG